MRRNDVGTVTSVPDELLVGDPVGFAANRRAVVGAKCERAVRG